MEYKLYKNIESLCYTYYCKSPKFQWEKKKNYFIDLKDFPGGSVVKNPPANTGDVGSIPGYGRSPEEGNANPLQYFCLGNPMDREAWWATV